MPQQRLITNFAKCAVTRACAKDPLIQLANAECTEGYGLLPCFARTSNDASDFHSARLLWNRMPAAARAVPGLSSLTCW